MTNATKHTPTPWDTMGSLVIRVEGPTSYMVARASSPEDAAHIVKCVNMHDELVEALANLIGHAHWVAGEFDIHYAHLDEVISTLKKAGAL